MERLPSRRGLKAYNTFMRIFSRIPEKYKVDRVSPFLLY